MNFRSLAAFIADMARAALEVEPLFVRWFLVQEQRRIGMYG